jgi:hypothetical protein
MEEELGRPVEPVTTPQEPGTEPEGADVPAAPDDLTEDTGYADSDGGEQQLKGSSEPADRKQRLLTIVYLIIGILLGFLTPAACSIINR